MLIHGTGDDRVHFQHTAQLTKSLSKSGITFKSQVVKYYRNTGRHLSEKYFNWIKFLIYSLLHVDLLSKHTVF